MQDREGEREVGGKREEWLESAHGRGRSRGDLGDYLPLEDGRVGTATWNDPRVVEEKVHVGYVTRVTSIGSGFALIKPNKILGYTWTRLPRLILFHRHLRNTSSCSDFWALSMANVLNSQFFVFYFSCHSKISKAWQLFIRSTHLISIIPLHFYFLNIGNIRQNNRNFKLISRTYLQLTGGISEEVDLA